MSDITDLPPEIPPDRALDATELENIGYQVDTGTHVATITLKRKDGKANAFTPKMMSEFVLALHTAEADENVKAIVLRSGLPPKEDGSITFGAGVDVTEMLKVMDIPDATEKRRAAEQLVIPWKNMNSAMDKMNKPIVAVVEGRITGASLTLLSLCDHVIADEEHAGFSMPEVHFDQFAFMSTPFLLRRLQPKACADLNRQSIGRGYYTESDMRVAREISERFDRITTTGEVFDAKKAEGYGFVHESCPKAAIETRLAEACSEAVKGETQPFEANTPQGDYIGNLVARLLWNSTNRIDDHTLEDAQQHMIESFCKPDAGPALRKYLKTKTAIGNKADTPAAPALPVDKVVADEVAKSGSPEAERKVS